MTAAEIVDTVERMLNASAQTRSWMGPSYGCHVPLDRPCTRPECIARGAFFAHHWAAQAAHEGHRLLEIGS
jgi:hypothetical protein